MYGLACAPYLAIRVLQQLARDEGSRFPYASDVVLNDMYVDDVLAGVDTISLARAKAVQVDRLLMAGGFTLHKWTTNESSVIADIDVHRHANSAPRDFSSEPLARALGLSWNPSSDVFLIQPRFASSLTNTIITKRVVISRVAQIFNPLGWISPITIVPKIFLQDLWKLKLDWDDPLSDSNAKRWREFGKTLATTKLSVPRWIRLSSASLAVELHGFSDASQLALGAIVYVRVLDETYNARVSLLAAKCKVAPLKIITIPRLELSVLLVCLIMHIRTALKLETVPFHLWVDSTVALT